MKKQKITIIPNEGTNVFKIGKKVFLLKKEIIKNNHIEKLIFEEIDKNRYKKKIDELTDEILKEKQIDMKTMMKQVLLELPSDKLEEIRKKIKDKKPRYKKGCLNIEIDGLEIPILKRASFLD